MILGIPVQDTPEFLPENPAAASVPEAREVHHIDRIVTRCLEKEISTLGITACLDDGYKLWDAELNKVYNQLRVNLKPEQQKALKAAQTEWIKYRDAEFAFKNSFYSSLQGTMYQTMNAEDCLEMVKKRTLELESCLKLLKE